MSYVRALTICLLLVYFVSAAGCHCFDFHEISLFFVLPTYVEIILMRWLHDPIVTKLCQNPWNGQNIFRVNMIFHHKTEHVLFINYQTFSIL